MTLSVSGGAEEKDQVCEKQQHREDSNIGQQVGERVDQAVEAVVVAEIVDGYIVVVGNVQLHRQLEGAGGVRLRLGT